MPRLRVEYAEAEGERDIYDPHAGAAMIFTIKLKISNAYLIRADRPILVDTGCPGEANRIVKALEEQNVRLKDLALIMHTHGHFDHCGSTRELKQREHIPAAIHPADAEMMSSGKHRPLKPTRLMGRILRPFVDVPFPAVKPDLLIGEDFPLRQYGLPAAIVATPGHTDGSISIVFDDGQTIAGDLLMGGYLAGKFLPRLPDYPYFADDLAVVRENILKLVRIGVETFHVGHGGPLRRKDVIERFARDLELKQWP